jgi:hypothetical protein
VLCRSPILFIIFICPKECILPLLKKEKDWSTKERTKGAAINDYNKLRTLPGPGIEPKSILLQSIALPTKLSRPGLILYMEELEFESRFL